MKKLLFVIVAGCMALAACAPPVSLAGENQPPIQPSGPSSLQATSSTPQPDLPHTSSIDLTRLTLGDGNVSADPQVGYVYSCMTQFNGGGAQGTGNWMNGDGTWDATKKAVVDGSVTWPHSFTVKLQGDQRVFSSNDLPDHPTGIYPVAATDDAYVIDHNPNSIREQTISFNVPANPVIASQPTCVGGEVGIMLSGVVIFSSFDAEGRDAVAHEVQDTCDGHPQAGGYYHYHSLSDCVADNFSGHSALAGYAFDGFGIYGYYGEDGREVTNADLDECHGHTHEAEWDGQRVEMYHYHATHEFPYVVGCFKGEPAVRALTAGEGQNGQNQAGGPQGGGAGQTPEEAINACVNLSQGAACSFIVPNGTINGTCGVPPNSSQMVCMPAGGKP